MSDLDHLEELLDSCKFSTNLSERANCGNKRRFLQKYQRSTFALDFEAPITQPVDPARVCE